MYWNDPESFKKIWTFEHNYHDVKGYLYFNYFTFSIERSWIGKILGRSGPEDIYFNVSMKKKFEGSGHHMLHKFLKMFENRDSCI